MFRYILLVLAIAVVAHAHKNPYYVDGRTTLVHLFEWKWEDIAAECERFLGPRAFGGVQISPPNENLMIWAFNRPWWERYQPISYRLITRSGNEQQFADMVRRCNNVGVRIYVDAIINHMTQTWDENVGTGGSIAEFDNWYYPGVPYGRNDFNWPRCVIQDIDYACCPENVRNCEFGGLKDLNQGTEYVRQQIVDFMNRLIELGVAGFRIDAAPHMWPNDLSAIYNRLRDLNTDHGFPSGARPFIYQEVLDISGTDPISRYEYTPLAAVTEFRFGVELSNAFRGGNQLRWLRTFGPEWGFLPNEDTLNFIDNHDSQRNHGPIRNILTHKDEKLYRGGVAFMLAHPYGRPQIMSSYFFSDTEAGPPADGNANIISPSINSDGSCGNGWACEHRWRQINHMVQFRNVASNSGLNDWWDNGSNQIAFCRGDLGFVAFNNDIWDLNENLQTCLPPGRYCDVISGERSGDGCTGKTVTVGFDGRAYIYIGANDYDMVLAIHRGDDVLTTLSMRCKFLQKLDLSWCGSHRMIQSYCVVSFLKDSGVELTHLRLNCCKFVDNAVIRAIVESCTYLQELCLRSIVGCTDWWRLASLRRLRRLDLYRTDITTLAAVSIVRSNPHMEHLNVGSCKMISSMDEIALALGANCPNLISVDFWKSYSLTPNGIRALGNCKNLQELDVGWCLQAGGSGEWLAWLAGSELRKLFLGALRGVCDRDLRALLPRATKLSQLDLLGVRAVTPDICDAILAECRELKLLDVSFCDQIQESQVLEWREQYPHVSIKRSFQSANLNTSPNALFLAPSLE